MKRFWLVWGFDALATLLVVFFFLMGLADGSVTSANAVLWFLILTLLGGIMLGSYWLQAHQHTRWAMVLLLILALPAVLVGAFFLLVLVSKPRWN